MKTLSVSMRTVRRAMAAARATTDDWQAQLLEILRIPAVAKRWRELNPQFPAVAIVRHDGMPHVGFTADQNRAICNRDGWLDFAGYSLNYGLAGYGWSSPRADYYAHSASTAWDGVRRETICRFVEAIYFAALGHAHDDHERALRHAGIRLTEARAKIAA